MHKITLVLLMLFLSFAVKAQEQEVRPKVGLVLSGGGAKGFAHVGVIRVLEDIGIKVDYVAGTSMGAVVGGLYAAGYTAKQLDSIFQITDPDALINDYPVRSSRISVDKTDEEKYAITLPVKNFNVIFPAAYSKGLYNYNFLNELTLPVHHINDFSKLPIPFLCVAQDIETGEEVILREGNLSKAMVASSAFPSLYYPVVIKGRKLVDGGIVNNFPVEELKKLGMDIIIGVNVQDDLKKESEISGGASGIVMQIANFEMANKMRQKEKLVDILIKPQIKDFNFFSFRNGREIIIAGEKSTLEKYPELAKLAYYKQGEKQNKGTKAPDSIYVNNISVNKLRYYNRDYVVGKLRFKSGTKIPTKKMYEGIINLNATKNFRRIDYSLDSNNNLNLNLTENKYNTYLRIGAHYDHVYKSGVLLNLTQKHLLFTNDVLSIDVVLGDSYRWVLDYYIDNGFNWSFGTRTRYNRFNYNLENDFEQGKSFDRLGINTANIDYNDFSMEGYVQTVMFKKFYSSAGFEGRYLRVESNTIKDTRGIFENDLLFDFFGRMKYDGLDKSFFPKKGWYFSGDFQTYLFSYRFLRSFEPFYMAKSDFGFVVPINKKLTVFVQNEGGFTIQNHGSPYLDFFLGGYGYQMINTFRHFHGYDFFSLSGDSYVKGTLTVDYEFYRKHHFNLIANYTNIGDDIFKTGEWITAPNYSGYALGYSYETFFGPVEIKQSWSPETNNRFTLVALGFRF